MSEVEVIETRRMDDGTEYRALIQHDPDPQEPYDDGGWPILRVEYKHYDYVAEAFNKQAEPYVDQFNELFERLRELRNWERFAKIFLGATRVHEWGFNRDTDYSYIAFDAKAWRAEMEMDTPEYIAKLGEEKPLAEIRAWIEGDVWGINVEKRWNPDEIKEEDEDWEQSDELPVWGFYGREWAEEAAKSALADAAMDHKVVYRYPEHEKIDPHNDAIGAIMEFIEGLWDKNLAICKDSEDGYYHSVPDSDHQKIVFEHFGIDYSKIQEERELMFQRLRDDAKEAID